MDDFGTGYSSLAYLQKFSIDSLKIDKSFVDDISAENNTAGAILNTIIAMGETLNLHVIAEGVETKAQLDYLSQTSCLYYQGYLFSKAIAEEDFIALVKKNKEETS
jgi:sensor c-di-GMP phosphodiesterase-like protein